MIDIVSNTDAFKKRVIRFFDSPKQAEVLVFVQHLSKVGEVLVFGGLLRDIALFGAKRFNSDIDFVVDCSVDELAKFFLSGNLTYSINKFGGYRLEVGGWSVDVWPVRETWAFKHAGVEYKGRESLLLTTITNWDSVVFSFLDRQIVADSCYLEQLKAGELEVILINNPNRMGVLVRVVKAICDKRARVLMPKLLGYLKEELSRWSADDIVSAQKRLLGRVYLSKEEYYSFRDEIFSLREDLFGSFVCVKGRNLSFAF